MNSWITVDDLDNSSVLFQEYKDIKKDNIDVSGIGSSTDTIKIDDMEVEKKLIDELSKISLLYEIPYEYLVPREDMLPEDTMSFFEIDKRYIKALLDGALSIGRNTPYDYEHDKSIIDQIYIGAMQNNGQIRLNLVPERAKMTNGDNGETALITGDIYSGFLLNSALVSDFNGLNVEAFDKNGVKLTPVRIENLSDLLMIGIFNGVIEKLVIAQPTESLCFGLGTQTTKVDGKNNTSYYKAIRDLKTGKIWYENDKNSKKIGIPVDDNRKIDIAGVASNMQNIFGKKITSAEYALNMIQNAYTVEIKEKKNEN